VPFAIIEALAADPVNGQHQHVDAPFVCHAATGQVGQLDHREVTSARWTGRDDMRKLNVLGELPPNTEAAISWATRRDDRTSVSQRVSSLQRMNGQPEQPV
jgi:hypothetical protein